LKAILSVGTIASIFQLSSGCEVRQLGECSGCAVVDGLFDERCHATNTDTTVGACGAEVGEVDWKWRGGIRGESPESGLAIVVTVTEADEIDTETSAGDEGGDVARGQGAESGEHAQEAVVSAEKIEFGAGGCGGGRVWWGKNSFAFAVVITEKTQGGWQGCEHGVVIREAHCATALTEDLDDFAENGDASAVEIGQVCSAQHGIDTSVALNWRTEG
jgi:hypothetical protein